MPTTRRRLIQSAALGAGLFALAPDRAVARMPARWDETVDVLVAGSGGAGAASAIAAREAGARSVLIVEKLARTGGNTRLSGGYFNAVDPKRQRPLGIEDSVEKFIAQTLAAGRGRAKPELVRILCEGALPALHWLESIGVRWKDECITLQGSAFPRGHVPTEPSLRSGCIDLLLSHARRLGVEIRLEHPLLALVREGSGPVLGAEVGLPDGTSRFIRARRSVVLATGGFAANARMCTAIDPRPAGLPSTNSPGSTGDGMLAAKAVGALLVGCDFIECIPLHAQYSRLALFVERCIFVNRRGRRFIREDAPRDEFRDAVLALPNREAFVVLDEAGFETHPTAFRRDAEKALSLGEVFRADSLEALARQLKVPAENLIETVAAFNESVKRRNDPEFGRSPESLRCLIERPIPRLYAAGEVSSGVHGESRLGGNSMTELYVFGRIAGREAARETPA